MCTHNRESLFGKVVKKEMVLNEFGKIVEFTWHDLPNHNSNIQLDEFIIMPNHIHGIIIIVGAGSKPAPIDPVGAGSEPAPTMVPAPKPLPEIIRQLKTFSAKRINQIRNSPGISVWQRNYYERIIRDEEGFHRVKKYIRENPRNWEKDENNVVND
ncbi:MAG: transposase [Chloroherpetonaceae bacterium]|nr:transposase [Chloroherpetonaceae bacterium]